MPNITRRGFCKAASSLSVGPTAAQLLGQDEIISRSRTWLEIGIHPRTGEGFIREKGSGEKWVWNWHEIVAADLRTFNNDPKNLRPVLPKSVVQDPAGFRLHYEESYGRWDCVIQLIESEVVFQVEPDSRYPCELGAIRFPPTIRPETNSRPFFLDTAFAGRMHRASQATNFSLPADNLWMRYYGVLGAKSAYLNILEPGFDAILAYADDGAGPLGYGWVHTPRMSTLQQIRRQRVRLVSSPSYVQLARVYRKYAMDGGFYVSLREKLEECPSLEKLFGAVLIMIGYLRDSQSDYAAAFRKLRSLGVEKAYVYPVGYFNFNGSDELYPGYRSDYRFIDLGPDVLKELHELDYLSAPWVWLNEIVHGSPFEDMLTLRLQDGSKSRGWRVGEVWWYASHEGRVLELLKEAAPKLRQKYSAAHFDVLNAGPCLENFGSWPYDRKADSKYRCGMFAEFSAHDRVVGSEQNKDWAIPYKHFGTAKLAGPYGKDAPYWPVPLWQLAFHDAVMTSWWEHSTYNDPDLGHDNTGREIRRRMLLDILTGDLPSVCPVGRMVGWRNPGKADREMFDFRYHIDDPVTLGAVQAAVEVARFNARHATDDLVHHEFLSEDGKEQQTYYASGTKVKIRLPATDTDAGELMID